MLAKKTIKKIIERAGIRPRNLRQLIDEYAEWIYLAHEKQQRSIKDRVKDKTMIGALGLLSNMDAIDYLCINNMRGCIVECGVWKGGSVAAMLYRLQDHGVTDRPVYLFDTFAGMTEPTKLDSKGSLDVVKKFQDGQKDTHNEWCYGSLEEVKQTIAATGYPANLVHYIQGDVLQTLPKTNVPEIALLRLDTDWYESTKAELEQLYPKVILGGVVIIDDYGAWEGARKAVDEYFQDRDFKPLMSRIDHTRRMFVKHDSR